MISFYLLRHFFFPRESNNQKAKILHPSGLMILISILSLIQVVMFFLPYTGLRILGYAANIPPSEVTRLTNLKRTEAGLDPLQENSLLSQIAQAKGIDMLNKGYWAHVSPDGTEPWKFFNDFGYKYKYAGENLARDFSDPSSAIEAWMASPTHQKNILSPKYKEVGVAVVEGYMNGVDTTIIVQHFGTKYVDVLPQVPIAKANPGEINSTSIVNTPEPSLSPNLRTEKCDNCQVISSPTNTSKTNILISPFKTTRSLSLSIVGLLLGVLVIDAIVVSQKRIVRVGGRTVAHMAFLGMILVITLILKAGRVL